jgi:hypothetical protein
VLYWVAGAGEPPRPQDVRRAERDGLVENIRFGYYDRAAYQLTDLGTKALARAEGGAGG